jgi:Ca-activated chloride channel family protein
VFGVPDNVMTSAPEGAVTVKVPTVFLSINGGGIFATLAKSGDLADLPAAPLAAGEPLLKVALGYRTAKEGREEHDSLTVGAPSAPPSTALRSAHLLVDQYLVMREATTAFHARNEPKTAFKLLEGYAARLSGSALPGMEQEARLTTNLLGYAAFYSGYTGELPKAYRHLGVIGTWEVIDASGLEGVERGDTLEFTEDRELNTVHKSARLDGESESYEINEKQIRLAESDTIFRYSTKGDELAMTVEGAGSAAWMKLRRRD